MKYISIALAGVVATLIVLAPPALADAPYPAPKPKPVPPVCTFLSGKDGKAAQPAVTAKGLANRGICRDRNGNKVWGTQFSYTKLTVTGYADTSCPVKKDFGTTGESGVIPVTLKGVTVVYTINVWIPKTTRHLASVRSDPRSTTSFTVLVPGGKPTVCSGDPPVVAPEGPNSPTGSGNGGDVQNGFYCSWFGNPMRDVAGIHIPPAADCSGNGSCRWESLGNSYDKYGKVFYPGRFSCSNGVTATTMIWLDVTYPDGSTCKAAISGVEMFPLPPSWAGDITATVQIFTWANNGTSGKLYSSTLGPIHGTGTTRLC